MPERFLLQILRSLVTHDILHSTRGVEGGYTLKRPAEDISLLDVIEAVDGPMKSVLPTFEGLPPKLLDQLCAALEDVTEASRQQLAEIKVSSLLPVAPKWHKSAATAANGSG
jgi:Rrf2 family protein